MKPRRRRSRRWWRGQLAEGREGAESLQEQDGRAAQDEPNPGEPPAGPRARHHALQLATSSGYRRAAGDH